MVTTHHLHDDLADCQRILAYFEGIDPVEGGDEGAIDQRERRKAAIADIKNRIKEIKEELGDRQA